MGFVNSRLSGEAPTDNTGQLTKKVLFFKLPSNLKIPAKLKRAALCRAPETLDVFNSCYFIASIILSAARI